MNLINILILISSLNSSSDKVYKQTERINLSDTIIIDKKKLNKTIQYEIKTLKEDSLVISDFLNKSNLIEIKIYRKNELVYIYEISPIDYKIKLIADLR